MKKIWYIACISLVISCQDSTNENTEVDTGTVQEIEPNQKELDEIALLEQPQLIQDFFAIDETIIGDDFCFDKHEVSQAILHNNSAVDWKKFELSDHYFTINESKCGVLLEFMTFELGEKKVAFLSQMNEGKQQFNYLIWDSKKNQWKNSNDYPKPELTAYFSDLNEGEIEKVNEYGTDLVYINPQYIGATFVFSEWGMMMNMGEKQMDQFTSPIRHEFELKVVDNQLVLEQVDLILGTEKDSVLAI